MKILPITDQNGVPYEVKDEIVPVILNRLMNEAREDLIKGQINEKIFNEVWTQMIQDLSNQLPAAILKQNKDKVDAYLAVCRLEIRRRVLHFGQKAIEDMFRQDEQRKSRLN